MATQDTTKKHCGNVRWLGDGSCVVCGVTFRKRYSEQKCCSKACQIVVSVAAAKAKGDKPRSLRERRRRTTAERIRKGYTGGRRRQSHWRLICERDGWICWVCQQPIDSTLKPPHVASGTEDHVIPLSKGGSDTDDNLKAAHFACNASRGNGRGNGNDKPLTEAERLHRWRWQLLYRLRVELRRRIRAEAKAIRTQPKPPRQCGCGVQIRKEATYCKVCAGRRSQVRVKAQVEAKRLNPKDFTCQCCGVVYHGVYGDKRRKYCSPACGRRQARRNRKQWLRLHDPVRYRAERMKQERNRLKRRKAGRGQLKLF